MRPGMLSRVIVEDKKWLGVVAGLACVAPLTSFGFIAYLVATGLVPHSNEQQLLSNVLTWAGIGVLGGLVVGIIPALLTTVFLVLLQRWRGFLHLGLFVLGCVPAILLGLVLFVGTGAWLNPLRLLSEVASIGGLILACVLVVWMMLGWFGVFRDVPGAVVA